MAELKQIKELPGYQGVEPDYLAIQEAIRVAQVNGYRRTANTKRISELSYSGRKVFRQKGTGRARQGERGNVHMYHGAVAFGPKPRIKKIKINRKQARRALISALLHHAHDGSLWLTLDDDLRQVEKTRLLDGFFSEGGFDGKVLIFCLRGDKVLTAARNHPRIKCLPVDRLNTPDLAFHDWVIFTRQAWDELMVRLGVKEHVGAGADEDEAEVKAEETALEAPSDAGEEAQEDTSGDEGDSGQVEGEEVSEDD